MHNNIYYSEKEEQKNVFAIHDISCVGRCSTTVALPILSAVGYNTGILPTALLSTHTGEFKNYFVHDLSDDIIPIAKHLQEVSLPLDAIYTGYLADAKQVDLIIEVFKMLKNKNTLIFVDPVFADHGKLYAMMTMAMVDKMRELITRADIIVPNITEALFLLGENPILSDTGPENILRIAKDLSCFGPKKVIITGIYNESQIGTFYLNNRTQEHGFVYNNKYDGIFHGTGDVFASALLAAILKDCNFKKSLEIAVEFTSRSIEKTILGGDPLKYGVRFEQVLPWLVNTLV
ncbi:MAG: pyridoxamine kinase [Christensenellaceae bacterium]|nr:pyridoxamine kinase [Christensenellaceae bacterium]